MNMETGHLDSVVLGVGINVYEPEKGFPEDIKDIAGAVFDKAFTDGKNILAAGFLNRFMRYYLSGDYSGYITDYRKRCFVIGRKIEVIKQERVYKGTAVDVDENCRLVVQYEDGTVERLSGGEIRLEI